ncbi:hypothetical protein GOBAR_AA39755 [Gossypium barbadense]|uniref:AB hydrolase-1 domain-containing protein n=1 Tax=Gossypium barbadense TaxID=3634 RepID=A0A2P5VQ41_GOSBA|nr:hypothetical protein GOBAR_AA39755 [Gossypium barbadense]
MAQKGLSRGKDSYWVEDAPALVEEAAAEYCRLHEPLLNCWFSLKGYVKVIKGCKGRHTKVDTCYLLRFGLSSKFRKEKRRAWLAGISPKKIEIQPGTVVNFWVPTQTTTKPAVVFLHGFAFDGILTWQFQALALAKHYSVYVPDFVFFGDSITDKSERSVEFQAECIAKGLKKLGVQKCTLVGFSYGGMVGFKMAEIYPELVHSMVATCSTMALTESISKARLHRLGFNSWPDFLLPDSVQGVETLVQLASHSFPKFPNFIYKEILEENC